MSNLLLYPKSVRHLQWNLRNWDEGRACMTSNYDAPPTSGCVTTLHFRSDTAFAFAAQRARQHLYSFGVSMIDYTRVSDSMRVEWIRFTGGDVYKSVGRERLASKHRLNWIIPHNATNIVKTIFSAHHVEVEGCHKRRNLILCLRHMSSRATHNRDNVYFLSSWQAGIE